MLYLYPLHGHSSFRKPQQSQDKEVEWQPQSGEEGEEGEHLSGGELSTKAGVDC